jgi:hypothetical protein
MISNRSIISISISISAGAPVLFCMPSLRVLAAAGHVVFYGRAGTCCSAHVLPSGSLKVTNEPHG